MRERYILGYLEKEIQNPMAQGQSLEIISMVKWIRTSRLSMKNLLSVRLDAGKDSVQGYLTHKKPPPPLGPP